MVCVLRPDTCFKCPQSLKQTSEWLLAGGREEWFGRRCEVYGFPSRGPIGALEKPASVCAGEQDLRIQRADSHRSDVQGRQSLVGLAPRFPAVHRLMYPFTCSGI